MIWTLVKILFFVRRWIIGFRISGLPYICVVVIYSNMVCESFEIQPSILTKSLTWIHIVEREILWFGKACIQFIQLEPKPSIIYGTVNLHFVCSYCLKTFANTRLFLYKRCCYRENKDQVINSISNYVEL